MSAGGFAKQSCVFHINAVAAHTLPCMYLSGRYAIHPYLGGIYLLTDVHSSRKRAMHILKALPRAAFALHCPPTLPRMNILFRHLDPNPSINNHDLTPAKHRQGCCS